MKCKFFFKNLQNGLTKKGLSPILIYSRLLICQPVCSLANVNLKICFIWKKQLTALWLGFILLVCSLREEVLIGLKIFAHAQGLQEQNSYRTPLTLSLSIKLFGFDVCICLQRPAENAQRLIQKGKM